MIPSRAPWAGDPYIGGVMRAVLLTLLAGLGNPGGSTPPELGIASAEDPWAKPLRSLSVEFALGPCLHQARIDDPKILAQLQTALRVIDRTLDAPAPLGPLLHGRIPVLLLDQGDEVQRLQVAGRNQLHHKRWGRLTLDSGLFRSLEAWLSAQEETQVRLTVENPFPADRVKRLAAFQGLLDRKWQGAELLGPKSEMHIHAPLVLEQWMGDFEALYVPSSKVAGESWGHRARLQTWVGGEFELELLDGARSSARPLGAVLVRHSELGLVWLKDSFRESWLEFQDPHCPLSPSTEKDGAKVEAQAMKVLAELARTRGQNFVLRFAGSHSEGVQQHLHPIPGQSLDSEWYALWKTARVERLAKDVSEVYSPAQRADLMELSWRDDSGKVQKIVGRGTKDLWLAPGVRVILQGSPWKPLKGTLR